MDLAQKYYGEYHIKLLDLSFADDERRKWNRIKKNIRTLTYDEICEGADYVCRMMANESKDDFLAFFHNRINDFNDHVDKKALEVCGLCNMCFVIRKIKEYIPDEEYIIYKKKIDKILELIKRKKIKVY